MEEKTMDYNGIYEALRKEKYDEKLQSMPKNFLVDFSEYLKDMKSVNSEEGDLFSNSVALGKKQLENAISLFKELMLRRKRKLLNLVFVAAETGIMKRDYENLLDFEREVFDKFLKAFEDGDKEVTKILAGRQGKKEKHRMVLFNQEVEEFVDFDGKIIGPYNSGSLVNLDAKVAQVLVEGGKGSYVDED